MDIHINVQKKHVWFLSGLILLVVGVGIVVAYTTDGSGNPAIMGHSADEIEGVVLMDFVESIINVSKDNVPAGWIDVFVDDSNKLEISVEVSGTSDVFFVPYTYRVNYSSGQGLKWSALAVYDNNGNPIKTVEGDGVEPTNYHGVSAHAFITGLPAGSYTFRVKDYSSVSSKRSFTDYRQLAVFSV